jgi:hypothetical protein
VFPLKRIKGHSVEAMEIDLYNLQPTTMTNIVEYQGDINLELAFKLIQICKIELIKTKTKRNKIKLPCIDPPGSILSLRFMDKTRGIMRTEKKKQFRNSITIDMSLGTKNVSLKLARTTIHMCGMRFPESSIEAANHLFEKLYDAQGLLNFIRKETKKIEILLSWIKSKAKIRTKRGNVKEIVFPLKMDRYKDEVRKYITMLLSYSYYVEDLDEYVALLESIIATKEDVIIEKPEILRVRTVMRNYNYSLGFKVNRWLLRQAVNGHDGFIASYNNSTQHHVKIQLPFEDFEYENYKDVSREKKKQKKIKYHSFFIYKSGIVTQSGRKLKYMLEALKRLLSIIEEDYEEIMNLSMDFLLDELQEPE